MPFPIRLQHAQITIDPAEESLLGALSYLYEFTMHKFISSPMTLNLESVCNPIEWYNKLESIASKSKLVYICMKSCALPFILSVIYIYLLLFFLSSWHEIYIGEHIGEALLYTIPSLIMYIIIIYFYTSLTITSSLYINVLISVCVLRLTFGCIVYGLHLYKTHVSMDGKAPYSITSTSGSTNTKNKNKTQKTQRDRQIER